MGAARSFYFFDGGLGYPGYSKNMNAFPKKSSLFDYSKGILMINIPEKVFGLLNV